ncbi:MAG: flagellar protein FliT [Gammaproteobacteria bacterium]|nr:flagellar protein FliT [Gammaproteobacteria bacterium]
MASPDLRAALTDIDTLSGALAAAAGAGEWSEVLRLDDARVQILASLPASCFDEADPEIQTVLEHALAVTRAVLDEARHQQASNADSLRDLHRGQRGARAYLNSGG